ncbi:hypothetical protein Tco_0510585 [Tanacetum coccineum]
MFSDSSSRSPLESDEKTPHKLRRFSASEERNKIRIMELSAHGCTYALLFLKVKEEKMEEKEDKVQSSCFDFNEALSHSFPVRRALSPKLMTWYLPPVQNSGKDAGTSFAFGLHAPIELRTSPDSNETLNYWNTTPALMLNASWSMISIGSSTKCSLLSTWISSNGIASVHHMNFFNFERETIMTLHNLSGIQDDRWTVPTLRFSSYVGIALLTITGGLDTTLDLNYFLSRLMDDLWASELTISNFSPADR